MTYTCSIRRVLIIGAVAMCAVLMPMTTSRALAQGRVSDALTPSPVTFHLSTLFYRGVPAGTAIEGQIVGVLDSGKVLTATLVATSGATSTVTGSLSDAGARITVRGRAGTFILSGHGAGRGGYGGNVEAQGATNVGAWLLIPEAVAYSYAFVGRVQRGPHRGQVLSGALALAASSSGGLDGTFTLDDGGVSAVQGHLAFGNLQVMVQVPGAGVVMGIAPKGQTTILDVSHDQYTGSFVGPGRGDQGTWVAISQ